LVSQPLPTSASQLAKPVLQAVIEQLPDAQAPIALAGAHACPHTLQFCRLVPRFVSQPLAASPSQLPKPPAQTTPHWPLVQVAVPFVVLQTLLQAPQLDKSELILDSQPFEYLPSQFWKFVLQALTTQAEFRQAALPFWATQVVPHVPQLVALLVVVASQPLLTSPSQLPNPAAQVILQTLPEQLGVPCELLHVAPHCPQLAAFVAVSASQPFDALWSQSWKLPLHDVIVHTPAVPVATHAPTALAGAHTEPQALQLLASVVILTSQPSLMSWLQSSKPTSHLLKVQTPAVHADVACGMTHLFPQPPQLFGSMSSLASQPFEAT
jgi:hypothetical protein